MVVEEKDMFMETKKLGIVNKIVLTNRYIFILKK